MRIVKLFVSLFRTIFLSPIAGHSGLVGKKLFSVKIITFMGDATAKRIDMHSTVTSL